VEISVAQGNFAAAALDFACVIPGVGFIKAGVKAEKLGEAVVKALKVEKALNKVAKAVEATGEVLGKGKTLALKVVEKIPKIHVEEVYVGGLRTAEGVEVGGFRYFAVKVGEKEGGKVAKGLGKAEPIDVKLKYKEGWTETQKAEADAKIEALNNSSAVKTTPERSGTSASVRYKKANGPDSVPEGSDVDHKLDLQLGVKTIQVTCGHLIAVSTEALGSK